ncbi:hypothetical protein DTO212C5_7449 [Paecilomyces variotii]|nr:hypothetical protein DTO212C5_7449 [Paecilomyces variotii]
MSTNVVTANRPEYETPIGQNTPEAVLAHRSHKRYRIHLSSDLEGILWGCDSEWVLQVPTGTMGEDCLMVLHITVHGSHWITRE